MDDDEKGKEFLKLIDEQNTVTMEYCCQIIFFN